MSQDSILVDPIATPPEGQPISAPAPASAPAKPTLADLKAPDDDSVPAKYRGKSFADVVQMHENAESRLGAQGQELGVWRNLVSDLSAAATPKANVAKQETALKVTSDELLTNPTDTISRVVKQSIEAALQPIKDSQSMDAKERDLAALASDFPKMQEIGNDAAFKAWAYGAKGRSQDAQAAARGDLSAARRLLEGWTDRQPAQTETTQSGKPQGVTGARDAMTEAGGSGAVRSSGKIIN
jgi:hypothetical protein